MRRAETDEKLSKLAASERWKVVAIVLLVALFGFALTELGFFRGDAVGEVSGLVVWSEVVVPDKGSEPYSQITAELPGGKVIYAKSAHTPPPVPGQRIALRVRRNIIGWHSYSWIVGKSPALTPGPASR